jgi:ATP-dependent Clp protease ATP-binding subunit ClpA
MRFLVAISQSEPLRWVPYADIRLAEQHLCPYSLRVMHLFKFEPRFPARKSRYHLSAMDFYNFFSLSVKKAIYRSSELCQQFRNQYLEPEHILYSVLNLRSCGAVKVLQQLGVDVPKMTYSLEIYLYEHAGEYKGNALFSQRTIGLLDLAYREVKRLHHREIGTTHLLIALAQNHDDFLAALFAEHRLDARKIRESFLAHLKGMANRKPDPGAQEADDPGLRRASRQKRGGGVGGEALRAFSPSARQALDIARRTASLCRAEEVSPLCLLCGLLFEETRQCEQMLEHCGAQVPALLERIVDGLKVVKAEAAPEAPAVEAESGFTVDLPEGSVQ